MSLIVYVDGGSRGNPGPAGAGVVICDQHGALLHEAAYFYPNLTNNEAEYHALIRALERIEKLDPAPIIIRSDSELLVRQLTGDYRVRSPRLAPLVHRAQMLLLRRPRWSMEHVPREANRRADELANLAIDRGRDLIVYDRQPPADADRPAAQAEAPGEQPARAGPLPPTETSLPAESGGPQTTRPVRVRVSLRRPPAADQCPAGGCGFASLVLDATLPAGICLHAAHALLPTLIAMRSVDPAEAEAIPTMTIRCTRPGCQATFHVAPEQSSNGSGDASA